MNVAYANTQTMPEVRSMVTKVKILSKEQAEVTLFGTITLKVSL